MEGGGPAHPQHHSRPCRSAQETPHLAVEGVEQLWSERPNPLVLAICRHPQHLPAAARRACRGPVVSSQLEGGEKEEEEEN